ncbi:hypothetical protein Tco_0218543, partial [Tanacetum coccineum]
IAGIAEEAMKARKKLVCFRRSTAILKIGLLCGLSTSR